MDDRLESIVVHEQLAMAAGETSRSGLFLD
jgi:hypothetical protein